MVYDPKRCCAGGVLRIQHERTHMVEAFISHVGGLFGTCAVATAASKARETPRILVCIGIFTGTENCR